MSLGQNGARVRVTKTGPNLERQWLRLTQGGELRAPEGSGEDLSLSEVRISSSEKAVERTYRVGHVCFCFAVKRRLNMTIT